LILLVISQFGRLWFGGVMPIVSCNYSCMACNYDMQIQVALSPWQSLWYDTCTSCTSTYAAWVGLTNVEARHEKKNEASIDFHLIHAIELCKHEKKTLVPASVNNHIPFSWPVLLPDSSPSDWFIVWLLMIDCTSTVKASVSLSMLLSHSRSVSFMTHERKKTTEMALTSLSLLITLPLQKEESRLCRPTEEDEDQIEKTKPNECSQGKEDSLEWGERKSERWLTPPSSNGLGWRQSVNREHGVKSGENGLEQQFSKNGGKTDGHKEGTGLPCWYMHRSRQHVHFLFRLKRGQDCALKLSYESTLHTQLDPINLHSFFHSSCRLHAFFSLPATLWGIDQGTERTKKQPTNQNKTKQSKTSLMKAKLRDNNRRERNFGQMGERKEWRKRKR